MRKRLEFEDVVKMKVKKMTLPSYPYKDWSESPVFASMVANQTQNETRSELMSKQKQFDLAMGDRAKDFGLPAPMFKETVKQAANQGLDVKPLIQKALAADNYDPRPGQGYAMLPPGEASTNPKILRDGDIHEIGLRTQRTPQNFGGGGGGGWPPDDRQPPPVGRIMRAPQYRIPLRFEEMFGGDPYGRGPPPPGAEAIREEVPARRVITFTDTGTPIYTFPHRPGGISSSDASLLLGPSPEKYVNAFEMARRMQADMADMRAMHQEQAYRGELAARMQRERKAAEFMANLMRSEAMGKRKGVALGLWDAARGAEPAEPQATPTEIEWTRRISQARNPNDVLMAMERSGMSADQILRVVEAMYQYASRKSTASSSAGSLASGFAAAGSALARAPLALAKAAYNRAPSAGAVSAIVQAPRAIARAAYNRAPSAGGVSAMVEAPRAMARAAIRAASAKPAARPRRMKRTSAEISQGEGSREREEVQQPRRRSRAPLRAIGSAMQTTYGALQGAR